MAGIIGGKTGYKSGLIGSLKSIFATTDSQSSFRIGNIRVEMGVVTTGSQNDCSCGNARYYSSGSITYSGFAVVPSIFITGYTGSHDGHVSGNQSGMSTTTTNLTVTNGRTGRVATQKIRWMVIGTAS